MSKVDYPLHLENCYFIVADEMIRGFLVLVVGGFGCINSDDPLKRQLNVCHSVMCSCWYDISIASLKI